MPVIHTVFLCFYICQIFDWFMFYFQNSFSALSRSSSTRSLDAASHVTLDSFIDDFETNYEITSTSNYNGENYHFSSSPRQVLSNDMIIDPCSINQSSKVEKRHFGFGKKKKVEFTDEDFPSLAEVQAEEMNKKEKQSARCAQSKTQIRKITEIKSDDRDMKADINGTFNMKIKRLPLSCKTGILKAFLETFGKVEDIVLYPDEAGVVALVR